jgi:hypothetical protein
LTKRSIQYKYDDYSIIFSHIDHCAIMQQSEIKEIIKLLVFRGKL